MFAAASATTDERQRRWRSQVAEATLTLLVLGPVGGGEGMRGINFSAFVYMVLCSRSIHGRAACTGTAITTGIYACGARLVGISVSTCCCWTSDSLTGTGPAAGAGACPPAAGVGACPPAAGAGAFRSQTVWVDAPKSHWISIMLRSLLILTTAGNGEEANCPARSGCSSPKLSVPSRLACQSTHVTV